jgi:hypothetical protein
MVNMVQVALILRGNFFKPVRVCMSDVCKNVSHIKDPSSCILLPCSTFLRFGSQAYDYEAYDHLE